MRLAEINGLRITYDYHGDRAPLLLVHGFPFDRTVWAPQIEAFAWVRRVVAPDLAGFGDSSEIGRATLDEHADDLAALLGALQLEQAVVCGLSMGGYVALAMWRRHPEQIAALVLADTRAVADTSAAAARRLSTAEEVLRAGTAQLVDSMLAQLPAPHATPDTLTAIRAIMLRQPAQGVAAALRAMAARPDSSDILASIDVPTLILVGAMDTVTPLHESEVLAAGIPGAELAQVPGAGHLSSFEEPGAFNAIVRSFLATVDARMGTT